MKQSTYGGGGYDGAESGLRQARSLSGTPTATGNVTFFPKYQVLFANGAAFDKLSEAQQAILREAAAAAQKKAIAEHPSEVEAAKTWCSDAGAVVLASDEQITAFEKAAQPVFNWIEQDPQNAELIAAIRELKAKTPPSPGVQACDYELAQQIPTSDASTQTWSIGLPPNGVWQADVTSDDLIRMGVSQANAPDWAAVYTQTFQDGVFTTSWKQTEGPDAGTTGSCTGPYALVDDFVRISYDNGGDCDQNEVDDIQWRIDDQGLMHFHLVNNNAKVIEVKATYEAKPYQKVENWSTGLPPNGVWQVTLTNDEVIKMGVSPAKAPDWSGVSTFTFQDGDFHYAWEGTEGYGKGQTASADGTYAVVDDFVRLTSDDYWDDFQWRLDEEGLHFHLLATQNDPFTEIRAILEAKPYQKVGDDASSSSTTSSSPDSFADNTSWITFQRKDSSDRTGVWLVHPDGAEEHQILTDIPVEVMYPSWSPDGKRIVVTSRGGDIEPLYEYDLATETSRQLFECKDPCLGDDEPVYSPDGTKVAFIRALLPIVHSDAMGEDVPSDCGLWFGDVATGEVTPVTSNTNPPCDREYLPRWSPDGSQLVYTRDPFENGMPTGTAVFVINADGSGERQLTDPTLAAGEADWSPDGEWIVFATYPLFEYGDPPGASNLYRIHPDGTGIEQLTFNETADKRATLPRYTPDGKWILFTMVTPEARSLWAIPAAGGEPIVIAQGRGNPNNYTAGARQPSP